MRSARKLDIKYFKQMEVCKVVRCLFGKHEKEDITYWECDG